MLASPFRSPLRYPGGKRKLAHYIARLFELNGWMDGDFAEPFAGGASVGLALLYGHYVYRIYLNDLDPAVYAFWASVLQDTDGLARLIQNTPLTMDQWHRQQEVLTDPDATQLDRGFAAFFLNRTNRAGIIRGGVMGGKAQAADYHLSDRFNRRDLTRRILKVARYRDRITLSNLDAVSFLQEVAPRMSRQGLIYLDPPYYVKGPALYAHAYAPADHAHLALHVGQLGQPWLVSYDQAPPIMNLYQDYEALAFTLHYSAQDRYKGGEVLFFSKGLRRPAQVVNPYQLTRTLLA